MIVSLSLPANDLYVGNEVYHVSLSNRLQHYGNYIQTVEQLLCFRDEAIKVGNDSDNIKSSNMRDRTSVKGKKYNKTSEDKSTNMYKSSWTRGTWVPPRRKESPPPPIPNKLVSQWIRLAFYTNHIVNTSIQFIIYAILFLSSLFFIFDKYVNK